VTGSDDWGVSDTLGAVLLIAIVAAAFSIIAVSFLSKPIQEQAPALSADITISGNTINLRHEGGDPIAKSELQILVDNQDKTSQFSTGGGTGWSTWSIGDTLTYTGSSAPSSVQIVYNHGSSSQLLQSWGMPPSAYTPGPTTPITPTPTVAPVPVAGFTGTPTSGTAPLTVTFTDSSTNNPTSWSWDFGDGGTATARNATHQYLVPGIFSVSLTATNSGGSNTFVRSGYIIVNPTITAADGTGGIITPNGSVVVPYGNSQAFSISKNAGYHIADVLVNGNSAGAVTTYTFPSVTADQTIAASFAQNTRAQIYYEGFESGTGAWSFTGDNSRQTGNVPKNQTASIRLRNTGTMTRTISTAGYSGIIAQFGWCAQSLDSSSEYVRAEYSTDGGSSWTTLSQITGPTGNPTTLTIVTSSALASSADNLSSFRLRFRIAGSATNDLLFVDDVKLTGIPN